MPQQNQENQEDLNPEPENLDPTGGDNTEDEEEIPAWQSVLYETNQRTKQLEEENRRIRQELEARNAPPPPAPRKPYERGEIFEEPERFRNDLLGEMEQQVAPLNSFVNNFKRERDYERLKTQMRRQFPQHNEMINQLEPHLDQVFLTDKPNLPINPQTLQDEIEKLVGRIALNNANQRPRRQVQQQEDDEDDTPPQNNRQVTPPNQRPSRTPARRSNTPKEPDINSFTENERRLMRERNYTPSEYVRMRDSDPQDAKRIWDEIKAERRARANGGK